VDADQLPHLGTFCTVAEAGSFTAAARLLGVTQAAVSQRVQALERDLGTALFRRRGGRALLTDAGRQLHAYAQKILALHREARRQVGGREPAPAGELSLAASSVPGEWLLPGLLADFRARHPHVRVRAAVADTREVLRRVEQGKADLGLAGGKGDSPHLEYRPFARDVLAVVVPASHPWAGRRRVTPGQLCGQPLILREAGSASRACLEQALTAAGRSPADLAVALELGSNEAIKEAVLRGVGAAVLSRAAVQKEVEAGLLRALPVAGLSLAREMFVVHDRRRPLSIPARLFLDLLESHPCPPAD